MNEKREIPANLGRDGEERALRRAQHDAQEIAARTGTPLVVYHDGKIEKRLVGDSAPSGRSETKAAANTES
jgi:hypothetical protein